MLGDGIGHVLATSSGQVWIGYFDEGIYGNYGWGRADTDEPVGAYGIVRFSPELAPVWHYPRYTEVGPWDAISDCYALNVDGTCAWACYYADFPVVCIRDGAVTGWHNDIKGASALAVAGSRVALFGGYGPDHDRLALTELGADRAQPAGEYRVVLSGRPAAPGRHPGHRPRKPPAFPHRNQLVPARHGRYPGMIAPKPSAGYSLIHATGSAGARLARGRRLELDHQFGGYPATVFHLDALRLGPLTDLGGVHPAGRSPAPAAGGPTGTTTYPPAALT